MEFINDCEYRGMVFERIIPCPDDYYLTLYAGLRGEFREEGYIFRIKEVKIINDFHPAEHIKTSKPIKFN